MSSNCNLGDLGSIPLSEAREDSDVALGVVSLGTEAA